MSELPEGEEHYGSSTENKSRKTINLYEQRFDSDNSKRYFNFKKSLKEFNKK